MASRKGFTLIELLIVVAIIAILALIAVPNFLEAQMRSKVSRVYSDMRSMAVAFEAYYVDNNAYPLRFAPRLLTSPIAYMTSLPIDPFATDDLRQNVRMTFEYVAPLPGRAYANESLYKDYFRFNPPYLPPESWGEPIPAHLGKPPVLWELKSWGPDRLNPNCPAGPGDDYSLAYDPSNGTVSHGDLCRFGP